MNLGCAPRGPPDRAFRPQVRPGGDLVQRGARCASRSGGRRLRTKCSTAPPPDAVPGVR